MRRNAAVFVVISLLSGFGSTAMALVAGIWIFDLSGSSSLAGLAGLCVYAPTLIAPWLGVLVDRFDRRELVIRVCLGLSGCLLTLWAVRSAAQVWLIFAVMLAYGLSYVVLDVGETALLPAALPAEALGEVNGWRSSAQEGMKLLAPLAGAGLYTWLGGRAVATVSAAVPLGVAGLYAALRLRNRAESPGPTGGGGLVAALRLMWRNPQIRVPVSIAAAAIAMSGFLTSALYDVVTHRLHLPSTFLGVLGSAQGAGSIAGGLVAGRLIRRFGPARVAAAGAVVFAVALVCRCLPWPVALVVSGVLIGAGLPWTLIAGLTAVQTHTPDASLGRVAAAATTVMFGPNALAIPIGAAATRLGGIVPHLMAAALVLAVVAGQRIRGTTTVVRQGTGGA